MKAAALRLLVCGFRFILLATPLAVAGFRAIAQDAYPNRPVKIIAPQAPGGGVDLVARIIAERLGRALGATFIVENQAGAGGAIAAQTTARARPDGYTLMIGYVATHGTTPAVKKNIYDPVRDFTPIAMLGGTPNVLVVSRAVPVSTLQEFVVYAKANQLPKTSVSEHVAAAFAGMSQALPAAVTAMCDSLLVDVAGLCVAARETDYVQASLRATGASGACTLIGHAGGFDVTTAALCNGIAAHGEDFDDTFEGGPVHAGAVIVPAVLATAEQHGLAGRDIARAIAVGCEVMCRLCLVAPTCVHKAGFHPTGVFGALGAAAGVACALSLNPAQWVNALGIAGSMASGIIEYLAEGASTKRMHPGWAAHGGYRAARLAQAGFSGPRTLFEGDHGFFHAFANSDDCDFSAMLDGAGERWLCADIAFKPYACGTMAHPYIDCARRLVAEGVRPGAVDSIECRTAEAIVHRLWEPLTAKQCPPNGYAAKFSIPYAVAVGMLRGDAGLVDYADAVVHDPNVLALAAKVRYEIDPSSPYPRQFTGHVRVTLRDGEVREASQDHLRGGREAPLSAEALETKFFANCLYGGWDRNRAARALAVLRGLPAAPTVNLNPLRG